MEKYVTFVLCVVLLSAVAPESLYPSVTKRYRTDYVYNRKTDAFYKLHIESRRRWLLDNLCQVEGAELMSPRSDNDLVQLHAMFKKYPDLGEYVWVADDGENHDSAEEQPIIDSSVLDGDLYTPSTVYSPNVNPTTDRYAAVENGHCIVVTREAKVAGTECYLKLPFICKVNAANAPYDPHCGVFAKDYKYYPSVKSCYKIPRIVYTWSEAYSECQAEGAHLVVLNSEKEREVVQELMNTEDSVRGARTSWFFFAGFRADKPPGDAANVTRVFKTIFNETLEQAGFSEWSANEPNNAYGREYCGSLFKNDGKLNDVDCTHEYAFICEKEVHTT